MLTPPHMWPIFLTLLVILSRASARDNDEKNRTAKDYEPDIEPYENVVAPRERSIFDYRKNGFRVDMKVVPASGNESYLDASKDERFPRFPLRDIGRCIIDFSFICIEKRIARFLQAVGELRQISLLGQAVKLVKTRVLKRNGRSAGNDVNEVIDRSIDDFFDTFALRVTLPSWNSKTERNQIDVMFDDKGIVEGRGKGGGGGGGGKGGGKCKKMMMMGMMAMKMKLIAIASIKGMMMSGMGLMLTMAMMASKFMKGGGGYGGGGGGGQLKEIVLLTKGPSAPGPIDSYGAPPPPSGAYGVPSGGDWQGGGGGWGRSFQRPPNASIYHRTNAGTRVNYTTVVPLIGEVVSHNNSFEPQKPQENLTAMPAYLNGKQVATDGVRISNDYRELKNGSYIMSGYPVTSHEDKAFADEWQPSEGKFSPSNNLKKISHEVNVHHVDEEIRKSSTSGI